MILVLTIIISMFLTSFVGMLVERIGYRPLRDAPRASAAITGLMIGIILETGNLAFLGARRIGFPSLIESTTYNIGGVFVTSKKIMIVVVSLLFMLALHQFVQRSKWGMAMRAMAFDYLVVPVTQVSPFPVTEEYVTSIDGTAMETYIDWMKSCYYITVTGLPALSVPCGFTPSGLPVGLQIVGPPHSELEVLQLGHALEQLTGHWQRAPALL